MDENIRVVDADPSGVIELGMQGEKNATRVVFDCSDLAQSFGTGEAELAVMNPKCCKTYAAKITQDGSSVRWDIGTEWTQTAGYGECQLSWFVGGVLAKSIVYTTHVKKSLGEGTPTDAPEPDYVESVHKAGKYAEQAEEAANAAKLDANRAEAAVERYPQIGENGNWFVWNAAAGDYVDTGRFSGGNAPYIGANGNWFIGTEDSGVSATGPVGPAGPAYVLTDRDKAEIVAATLAALPKAEEAEF